MKAVLSHRIYLEVSPDVRRQIEEKLTYSIETYGDTPPIKIRNYSLFRNNILMLPSGCMDFVTPDYEIVDKRAAPEVQFPPFKGTLRGSQQEIYDDVEGSCLINAKVGWGKTFTALAIAAKFGLKTLVVVNTLPLMHQWAKEVEKAFGIKPGLVGGGFENYNGPIVIGNVASLERRTAKINRMFGTIIVDEVHHCPSRTFTKVVDNSYAKNKIGLSGTLKRKDGYHVVIPNYFGSKLYCPEVENTMAPTIHVHNTGIMFPFGDVWAHRVSDLHADPAFFWWVVNSTRAYMAQGHKVLVVADRVDFLKRIHEEIGGSLTIGETQDREGELAKIYDGRSNSMTGTLQIWKEGISCNPLSCVVQGTPINNEPMLEQLIGRVQRMHPGKLSPVVADPLMLGPTAEKQFLTRMGFYMRQGWDVENI